MQALCALPRQSVRFRSALTTPLLVFLKILQTTHFVHFLSVAGSVNPFGVYRKTSDSGSSRNTARHRASSRGERPTPTNMSQCRCDCLLCKVHMYYVIVWRIVESVSGKSKPSSEQNPDLLRVKLNVSFVSCMLLHQDPAPADDVLDQGQYIVLKVQLHPRRCFPRPQHVIT